MREDSVRPGAGAQCRWGRVSLSTGGGFARKDACLNYFLMTAGFNIFPTPKGAVGFVLLFMPWTNSADACWERRNPLWSWGCSYLKTLGWEGCGELCPQALQLSRSGEFVQSIENNAKTVAWLLLDMDVLLPPLKKILPSKFNPVAHYSWGHYCLI